MSKKKDQRIEELEKANEELTESALEKLKEKDQRIAELEKHNKQLHHSLETSVNEAFQRWDKIQQLESQLKKNEEHITAIEAEHAEAIIAQNNIIRESWQRNIDLQAQLNKCQENGKIIT